MSDSMATAMTVSTKKLQQLENIANGSSTSIDGTSLKIKIAHFLLAHADKVMDTVAPLEALRETMKDKYIELAIERLDDVELSPGMIARMIGDIQSMNQYSIDMLKNVLTTDKLQTVIAVDASTNITTADTASSVLDLNSSLSRSKVAKAVAALNQIMMESDTVAEDVKFEEIEGDS